jgi:ribosomal protein S18 acetylase RimI-like enzyme
VSGARRAMTAESAVIRPIALGDIAGFRDCVGAVIRERQYLAFLEPFPLDQTASFVAGNIGSGNPHFVAFDDGRIVGWCDIKRQTIPIHAHEGLLGMGVLDEYRGRGLGERLLRTALEAARAGGFERVSLSVYARNTRALELYRKVGFAVEGTRVRGKKLDGEYDNVHMMAIVF